MVPHHAEMSVSRTADMRFSPSHIGTVQQLMPPLKHMRSIGIKKITATYATLEAYALFGIKKLLQLVPPYKHMRPIGIKKLLQLV